ncbi:MAG: glutamate--tRNA ligase [Deltaproteobacteria bacterium]|nr:glutamate--tRNA ligase [Deltaproteobacteria bacterium]
MVRVRIAPSPTGDPHVGTAYIALFNYVFAKKNNGQFVLRIEDTDRTRSKPEWEHMIIDAMKWLGLSWDEGPDIGGPHGPYRQSERGAIYAEHAELLLEKGGAYRCFCTEERLAGVREEQRKAKVAMPGYDGFCRKLTPADVKAKLADKIPFVVRLVVPDAGVTMVKDKLRGEVSFENAQVDDQVLLKSDGMPTYHLANVVDDHLMEITHVIRAEEWITSTPKHVLLYKAFGWAEPEWIHMPLLRNADKSKISKRKNPVSLNYYRESGYLPRAMLNYLGMMGWTMPDAREKFSLEEMIPAFGFDRISLGGPVFDIQKLTWLNGLYIREQSADDLAASISRDLLSPAALEAMTPLIRERVNKLEDVVDHLVYFFAGDVAYSADARAALVPKGKSAKDAANMLAELLEIVDGLAKIEAADIEAKMKALCDKLGWKTKEFFMPVRVAVTGRTATPPLHETMAVMGKERCRRRLRAAIAVLKSQG